MKSRILGSVSAALVLFAPAALAQEDAPAPATAQPQDGQSADGEAVQDTVYVTATRRTEDIQDVPISISAFAQRELSEKGIVGYEGLAAETPGVILNKPSANFNNFTARGLAINGYNANLQSTVAIYIDEVPISANGNSTILDPNLFDVERVEFLRGPQGTLFGSGSLAGAVRILNKNPDLDEFQYSGLVDFGLIDEDSVRQRYNAMVNMPIVEDQLALRVVGFYRNEGGWVDNIGTGEKDANELVNYGGRAILLAEPTDRLSVRLLYSHEKSNPRDSSLISPELGERVKLSDRPDLYQGKLTNINATIDYDFDWATFTSSSTSTSYDQKFYIDLAGTFGQAIPFALDADAYDDIFTQELRLASADGGNWDWTIGGFYFTKRRDVDLNYRSRQDFLDMRGLTGLPSEYYQRAYNYGRSNELAAFGELTYHVSDRLRLIGGLRYGNTDAQGFAEDGGYNSNYLAVALGGFSNIPLTVTPLPVVRGEKAKEKGPSYKASISYDFSDDVTTYATYATGFRAPVRNARAGLASSLDPTEIIIPDGADSDDLKSYEAGVKGFWFDRRLSANIAAYFIEWNDIQVQANRVSDQVQFATNIGGAESKGLEFEVGWLPTHSLSLGLYGSFNDAKVTDLTPEEAAISGAVLGARMAAPKFQAALSMKYDFTINAEADGFFTANLVHVGSFPGQLPNTPGRPTVPSPTYDFTDSWEKVNLSLGANFDDWTVIGYVENVFDDDSITYVHPEAFAESRYGTHIPRTIGIRISKGI
ncbi:MAG: TonB-dependent receptor [Hyphomonas sp.]|nr:TonB-dependent receptor [Hyphomonas sp.]